MAQFLNLFVCLEFGEFTMNVINLDDDTSKIIDLSKENTHFSKYNNLDDYEEEFNNNDVTFLSNNKGESILMNEAVNILLGYFPDKNSQSIVDCVANVLICNSNINNGNELAKKCFSLVMRMEPLSMSSSSSSSSKAKDIFENQVESILQIFPDADRQQVNILLSEMKNTAITIQHMAEKGYKKIAKLLPATTLVTKLDFRDVKWITSSAYRENAITLMCNNYPFIKVVNIRNMFLKHNYHYYPTLQYIEDVTNIAPLQRHDYPLRDVYITHVSCLKSTDRDRWILSGIDCKIIPRYVKYMYILGYCINICHVTILYV